MIRLCQEEDIPLLLKRFKDVYPANPRLQERDFFDWQFKANPFNETGTYTFFCFWSGSAITGFIGYSPTQVVFDGDIYKGCWIENWYADNGTAGIALLSEVMSLYDNRFMAGVSKDGIEVVKLYKIPYLESLPRWLGILDERSVAKHFGICSRKDLEKLSYSAKMLNGFKEAPGLFVYDRFAPGTVFHPDQRASIKGSIHLTADYLNWRYMDIPRHNYRAVGGPYGQFAVYRIEKIKGYEEAVIRILEWHFFDIWIEPALKAIVQDGKQQGAILLDFFCTAHSIGSELEDWGLLPSTDFQMPPIPYLFRPVYYNGEGIRIAIDMPPHRKTRHVDFNEWYLTKGVSDLDRIKF